MTHGKQAQRPLHYHTYFGVRGVSDDDHQLV